MTETCPRLDAYYYAFDPTGCPEVDRLLAAVAAAGRAFHHTESWSDDSHHSDFAGNTPVDWIQNEATFIAKEIARLRTACVGLLTVMPVFPAAARQIVGMEDRYNAAIQNAWAALGKDRK